MTSEEFQAAVGGLEYFVILTGADMPYTITPKDRYWVAKRPSLLSMRPARCFWFPLTT
jgi:hypothetical protein